jgi:uncharacterized LabA/DUF88 family protein
MQIGNNIAFVDGQNLYLGTTKSESPWKIDLFRFRIYLKEKYNVSEAFYFLGAVDESQQDLYDNIQRSGFILKFREHSQSMIGKKKGNVDTDIVFSIMKTLYKQEKFNKIILVSGDGDYFKLVDFLITENRFEKILFPCEKFASSLYKILSAKYCSFLDQKEVKNKLKYK